MTRATSDERAVVGGDHHAVPLAAGLEHDQRQVVLGPDGALQLAVEHELERAGRQQLASPSSIELNHSSWALRGLVQAVFLDLVEQRLVADAEDLRGFLPVPARPLQHLADQLALGLARRVREMSLSE